jgi:Ser/Thr protein kinase RdoA (MazF antagonist)
MLDQKQDHPFDTHQIEKIWGLKDVRLNKILQQSYGHRMTLLIDSTQGKFVYKVASPWKDERALEKDTVIFDFLNEKGCTFITKLLKTVEGKNFATIQDRFVYVLEYVEGKNPARTVETYKKLGEITAILHSTEGYQHRTDFNPQYIIEHNFKENAEKFSFSDEYLKISKTLPNFSQFSQTLIHTDISPENTVEREGGSLVFVDWDDAGIGPTVLDLGYVLMSECTTENLELKPEIAKAFYSSYLTKRNITPEEKTYMFDAGLFFALMYIVFGDVEKRWKRIQWLIENRKVVEAMIP